MTTARTSDDLHTVPFADLDAKTVLTAGADGIATLLGSRCDSCGTRAFPTRLACDNCGARSLSDVPLAREGTLYSFTTVHVSSARPTPYVLGYVDLADGVRVLAGIAGASSDLHPDRPVELLVGAGDSWSFRPTTEQTGASDA